MKKKERFRLERELLWSDIADLKKVLRYRREQIVLEFSICHQISFEAKFSAASARKVWKELDKLAFFPRQAINEFFAWLDREEGGGTAEEIVRKIREVCKSFD